MDEVERVRAYMGLQDENRKLKLNTDHLFKLVVALLHNAGGEVVLSERIMGEASLIESPEVVSWTDIDTSVTEFHIKLKKSSTT